jgi:hypothetical protein
MHSFKTEDLLLYIYGDTSTEQTSAISLALQTDWNLREEYNELLAAHQQLNEVKLMAPRRKAFEAVMDYAAKKDQKEVSA